MLKAYAEVEYLRAERNSVADALSRLPMLTESVEPAINLISFQGLEEFLDGETVLERISQSKDPVLTLLKRFITNGWSAYAPYKLKPFSKAKDECTIQNGGVYRGLRVVPPRDMRQRILHTLYCNILVL